MESATAINACEKGKQWEEALRLLHQMTCRALTPNVISCVSDVCARFEVWNKSIDHDMFYLVYDYALKRLRANRIC